jgi:hypothetical protein
MTVVTATGSNRSPLPDNTIAAYLTRVDHR